MKNKLPFIAAIFLFITCTSDIKTGIPFESISIEMAKKNKVTVSVYRPNVSQIANKHKVIKIIEAWSENSWCYKDTDRNVRKLDDVNFIIRFDKELEEITGLNGRRPGEKIRGLGTTNYRLFTRLNHSEQLKDTLVFLFDSDNGPIPIAFTKGDLSGNISK